MCIWYMQKQARLKGQWEGSEVDIAFIVLLSLLSN